jgi:hypothetical protein
MNLEELLTTVPEGVQKAIEEIIEKAGTSDASWQVLKAAGEMLYEAHMAID